MTVMSKFFGERGWRVSALNCYETGHTWAPGCTDAAVTILKASAWDSFKTYTILYVLTFLVRSRKLTKKNCQRIVSDIFRSTAFLTTNAFMFMTCLCGVRRLQGFWILPHLGFTNSLIASFLAILVEKKNRRPMLALYLTNLASEVAFNMACNRGWAFSIPKGQTIIFSMALAGYFYLRKRGKLSDQMANGMEMIFGSNRESSWLSATKFWKLFDFLKDFQLNSRSRLCKHNNSCVHFAIEGFLRNFLPAYGGSAALSLVTSVPKIIRNPKLIISSLIGLRPLKLAAFFGLLPLISSGTNCVLNNVLKQNNEKTQALCGALAGCSMLFYPSTSIAMYAFWKLIEIIYHILLEKGYPLYVPFGDILLYSFSTAFVLFAGVIEPHAIRPAYWNFLQNLTGNCFGRVNRALVTEWGTDADHLLKGFRPKLDPKYTSHNPIYLAAESIHSQRPF